MTKISTYNINRMLKVFEPTSITVSSIYDYSFVNVALYVILALLYL